MDFINTGYGATDDLGALFKKKKAKPKPVARTAPRIVAPRPAVAKPTALVKAAKPAAKVKVKAPKPKTSLTDILSKGAKLVTDGIKAVNNAGLTKQPLPVPSITIPKAVAPATKAPVRRVVAPKPATPASSGLAGVPMWAWLAAGGVALVALMGRGGGSTSSSPVYIPAR